MDIIWFAVDHQSGMTPEEGIVAIKGRFSRRSRWSLLRMTAVLLSLLVYPERSPVLFFRDEVEESPCLLFLHHPWRKRPLVPLNTVGVGAVSDRVSTSSRWRRLGAAYRVLRSTWRCLSWVITIICNVKKLTVTLSAASSIRPSGLERTKSKGSFLNPTSEP